MSYFRQDGFFWVHDGGDAGDLIYNTLSRILDQDDNSDWAWESFESCGQLLKQGKRWPNSMNDIPTKRSQTLMTRDPYIVYYTLAVKWDCIDLVKDLPMPWYCFSPIVSLWRHKLINDNQPLWKKRLDYYRAKAVVFKNHNDPNIIANENEAANS